MSEPNKQPQNITQEYADFMSGFQPTPFINSEWEKRGDAYVQFSFYDESLNGISVTYLTGTLQNT